ncbi:hypothetical protein D3P08_15630 [Paenibacillus nanensis]|uniref:Flagellar hook-length control protein FliK n=1 Tax=Paenibacillus nanensis TaxID=393251 RepID=A0A3A1UZQ7_9BACL|nr:hypothetical protein [Paenibacillus nanensis]RIX51843.1 hypothetical protein D3P08_15630 [Paenibacillus nanensis]
MNISQIMRGLLGEAVSGDVRAMELKIGQMVRGVVLQTLENNEALIQINGVQVRAKLELPLSAGQTALLQVQPESTGSLVVLKAVDPSVSGLLDDTFRDLAKMLGMPDQKWALDIIKDLRKEGFPFNRATAQSFQEAAAAMPKGADQEQWMNAAAATFKRGLPMTGTTVASMGQTMFGKPVHELLDTLQRQLSEFIGAANESLGKGEAAAVKQAGARVLALLEQGAAMMRGALASQDNETLGVSRGGNAPGQSASNEAMTMVRGSSQALAAADDHAANGHSGGRGAQPAGGGSNWLGGMMKWLGVDHEHQLAKAATAIAPAAAQSETLVSGQANQPDGGISAKPGQGAGPGQGVVTESANGDSETNMHANNAALRQRLDAVAGGGLPRSGEALQPGAGEARPVHLQAGSGAHLAADLPISGDDILNGTQNANASVETLKSALMSLTGANDTPAAIKETAQQLVQQITGQQLLLTPERNSSVFTHVTMFIPFQDAKGGSTASVHIQTRRGKRGELDAENCRLLFNLTMSSLGDTLVDVNIADKIVSLNIWNDHPAITELVEGSKSEIADRLQATGYQLLSLRTTPLPKRNEEGAAAEAPMKGKIPAPPDLSQFASTRYKGVDFRA